MPLWVSEDLSWFVRANQAALVTHQYSGDLGGTAIAKLAAPDSMLNMCAEYSIVQVSKDVTSLLFST